MKIDLNLQKYVEWKVNGIMQIKDAYGYRVKLMYADGSEFVMDDGGNGCTTSVTSQNATQKVGFIFLFAGSGPVVLPRCTEVQKGLQPIEIYGQASGNAVQGHTDSRTVGLSKNGKF